MTANGSFLLGPLLYLLFSAFSAIPADGQVRYIIPEEMAVGSFVGNIAKDLGLESSRLATGRGARLFFVGSNEYVELDREKGQLLVRERIDREQLCGDTSACSFTFEIILEDPIELFRVTVEIEDINDNSPVFPKREIELEISELAVPGARFALESAVDSDVGINTLQEYLLRPAEHFTLKTQSRLDGSKNVEMVLQTALDREKQEQHYLTLTAVDGGDPQRSGTVKIHIVVLDANDNAPIFSQSVYRAAVVENSPKGTLVLTLSATDADEESNGSILYYFEHTAAIVRELFTLEPTSGDIKIAGEVDFEKHKIFHIKVKAKDQGGLTDSSEIIIEVVDVNDNAPKITLMSFSSALPEDSVPGTVIAILNVLDLDSGDNGKVSCSTDYALPFKIQSSLTNYFSLVTDSVLDREDISEYNITVIAVDGGVPPLTSKQVLRLKISDVNDHAPRFEKDTYSAYLPENNAPSMSFFSLRAKDDDWGSNSRVSYFVVDDSLNGVPLSRYISINSETGTLYAVTTFDYEQIKTFTIQVKAQDGGSPPLSSNVTVNIFIQDQNDNAPQVLYPVQTGGSLVAEMVPRSADVGYLVTKVVAVDVDSGQNAWLSYKLLKTTERGLFDVGLQNGEIRTVRQVSDKDPVKQTLAVVVEDNGHPSRSATVNVNVVVADSFPEVLSEFSDFGQNKDYNDNLTFYLILALAVVSFLFILSVIAIISVKFCRWWNRRLFFKSNVNLPVIPYYPSLYADVGTTGTLKHMYSYGVYGTADSRKSALNVNITDVESMQRKMKEDGNSVIEENPPNTDWRFSQNQRPGPSGASPEEATGVVTGTGPWPNPPTEAEQLQALMAAANEVSEATATLGPGSRYGPQLTLQRAPDFRQNVYIPGSTATLTANPPQQALPPPQAQVLPPSQADAPKAAQTPASKKKVAKKDKK
ncbi:protocadherin gamma-A11-like isoform X8 [Scleropages formosus]|uniref:protocadherin gamma-A11-like isoform X8 n=1 Tax=Scleropages formosus TaxID=113540 RepID=UPI0010FAAD1B|nr:protocadherin gamma-A11-like isoform X8 [Scleropages formosus]